MLAIFSRMRPACLVQAATVLGDTDIAVHADTFVALAASACAAVEAMPRKPTESGYVAVETTGLEPLLAGIARFGSVVTDQRVAIATAAAKAAEWERQASEQARLDAEAAAVREKQVREIARKEAAAAAAESERFAADKAVREAAVSAERERVAAEKARQDAIASAERSRLAAEAAAERSRLILAAKRASYNHAEGPAGPVMAAAEAGDVAGIVRALDAGASTEEKDSVSGVLGAVAAWEGLCRASGVCCQLRRRLLPVAGWSAPASLGCLRRSC
jgi:hypothetical protein